MRKKHQQENQQSLLQEVAIPNGSTHMLFATLLRQVMTPNGEPMSEIAALNAATVLLNNQSQESSFSPSALPLILEDISRSAVNDSAEPKPQTAATFPYSLIGVINFGNVLNLVNAPRIEHPFPEDSND